MSYHGKLQTLKNGTADSEIQLWAYQQIETIDYLYKTHDKYKAQLVAAKQLYLDAFERAKQIGYAEGMMNRPVNVQNVKELTEHEQGKAMNNEPIDYPPLKAGGIIENNEPVAFWNKDFDLWEENAIQTYKADGWNIPLYTHPAKTLTVSTDDVANLVCSGKYWTLDDHLNIVSVHFDKFVEAILRKEQE